MQDGLGHPRNLVATVVSDFSRVVVGIDTGICLETPEGHPRTGPAVSRRGVTVPPPSFI